MRIKKNSKQFRLFEKSYWNYFLELEEQFISTKRYVAFDRANYKAHSLEYLKLLEAVCSEIDIVGKEIAHQIDPSFKIDDRNSNIKKWWYIIQDWVIEDNIAPVKVLDELEFNPWEGYRIEQFTDAKGSIRLRSSPGVKTPYWWTSYNKVKHNRTLVDPDTQEKFFHRANLENLFNAFSALYILEKRFMISVGRAEDYNRVQISQLFERKKPQFYVDENGCWCQVVDEEVE